MVLILLTFVFLLMRVAPGDPISASLGGHVPQSVIDEITHQARLRPAALEAVPRVPREHLPGRLRDDDHRPAPGQRHHPRERRRDARADLLRDDRRGRRRRARRPRRRPLPRHAARRRRPHVRDRHLRDARLLHRADGAALLRLVPRLVTDLGPREPDHPGDAPDPHEPVHDRLDLRPQLERAQGRHPAPDPAGGHARARHGRRLHPPDPRERDPDAQGRLHRGGARPRDQGARRRLPPRASRTRSCR